MNTLYTVVPSADQQAIPTNIITGFLGVGKTTAIRWLLQHKPAAEHWAVLVNEFGEVGIDGELLELEGIAVKQVAGGCMCCATGVPSRVALNQLIRQQRPDRILIEPTGLAHPRQILQLFGGKDYAGLLDLRATVCLLDPWSLSEPRFLALPAFNDQIQLADVLVATKADSAEPAHLQLFADLVKRLDPAKARSGVIAHGELPPAWLDTPIDPVRRQQQVSRTALPRSHQSLTVAPEAAGLPPADPEGVTRLENHSDNAFACGWLFNSDWCFDLTRLQTLLESLPIPRIKGVIRTGSGWHSINRMRDVCRCESVPTPQSSGSRLEMISMAPCDWLAVDQRLRQCRI